jgi:hypothetical protein
MELADSLSFRIFWRYFIFRRSVLVNSALPCAAISNLNFVRTLGCLTSRKLKSKSVDLSDVSRIKLTRSMRVGRQLSLFPQSKY